MKNRHACNIFVYIALALGPSYKNLSRTTCLAKETSGSSIKPQNLKSKPLTTNSEGETCIRAGIQQKKP